MFDPTKILFIHGSESSSQTYKARLLREIYPGIVVPDFTGRLEERMVQLARILDEENGWTLIGSSLGGTMAALYAAQHPERVRKLVLLAPALTLPEFADHVPDSVPVPVVMIHGSRDEVVPPEPAQALAEKAFPKLTYMPVDDDHRLHETARTLDWRRVVESDR
jgi:pimeloyl-ACP methyl ester carboxylesterase